MLTISYSISFVDFGSLTQEERYLPYKSKLIDNTYSQLEQCEYQRVLTTSSDNGYDFSRGLSFKKPGVMLLPLIKVVVK